MCCSRLAANTGRKKSPKIVIWAPSHNFVGLYLRNYGRIDNRKKLVKQQYVLHMSPQYGELRPTNGWDPFVSLGHPCKFQRVSRLGSVTALHLVVGVSKTLRRWTEGATYIRQGGHHVGHWPIFLVVTITLHNLIKSSLVYNLPITKFCENPRITSCVNYSVPKQSSEQHPAKNLSSINRDSCVDLLNRSMSFVMAGPVATTRTVPVYTYWIVCWGFDLWKKEHHHHPIKERYELTNYGRPM